MYVDYDRYALTFSIYIHSISRYMDTSNSLSANQTAVFGSHTPIYRKALFTTSGSEESSGKEEKK